MTRTVEQVAHDPKVGDVAVLRGGRVRYEVERIYLSSYSRTEALTVRRHDDSPAPRAFDLDLDAWTDLVIHAASSVTAPEWKLTCGRCGHVGDRSTFPENMTSVQNAVRCPRCGSTKVDYNVAWQELVAQAAQGGQVVTEDMVKARMAAKDQAP